MYAKLQEDMRMGFSWFANTFYYDWLNRMSVWKSLLLLNDLMLPS